MSRLSKLVRRGDICRSQACIHCSFDTSSGCLPLNRGMASMTKIKRIGASLNVPIRQIY
ncbi:hypothetical protein VPHD292_0100 [Vibrio phage D292]